MLIYDYDTHTGEYLGSRLARALPGREQLPDNNLTKWQISANATTIAPPTATQGTVPRYRDGEWAVVSLINVNPKYCLSNMLDMGGTMREIMG